MKRFAVIGLGNFGLALVRSLTRLGAQVTAVDNDMSHVEAVKEEVHSAVRMDARDRGALQEQRIHEVDCAIVCMGEDFEAAEICCVHLIDLGCPRVLVRGTTSERVEILEALGPEVITPGLGSARQQAVKLLGPGLSDFASFLGEHDLAMTVVPESANGATVGDRFGSFKVQVLAVRRGFKVDSEVFVGPAPTHVLRTGDHVFLLGTERELIRVGEMSEGRR